MENVFQVADTKCNLSFYFALRVNNQWILFSNWMPQMRNWQIDLSVSGFKGPSDKHYF